MVLSSSSDRRRPCHTSRRTLSNLSSHRPCSWLFKFRTSCKHAAHLSRQEVDLCDGGGVFVQSCELDTRGPVAARGPSRKSTTKQSFTSCMARPVESHTRLEFYTSRRRSGVTDPNKPSRDVTQTTFCCCSTKLPNGATLQLLFKHHHQQHHHHHPAPYSVSITTYLFIRSVSK